VPEYKKKDFESDQTVRWCPGCGDYAILSSVQKTLAGLGIPRENFVIVSGIGCSSRFPYYMNTYGFHTIHGRAPAIATGLKVSRPELSVWVVTGDGDALSIGGNHILHALRRNVDIKVLLFNNRIYGLTKGQYSPTSEQGKRTKTSPYGAVDRPVHPISIALAAEATFVARCVDVHGAQLQGILTRAAKHRGSVFIEILQNCIIFNDGAFDDVRERKNREGATVELVHGKPLVYGKDRERGIRLAGFTPELVRVGPGGVAEEDLLHHDEKTRNPSLAYLLSQLQLSGEGFPMPMGVFRALEGLRTYGEAVHEQIRAARQASPPGDLDDLLREGETWEVGAGANRVR
ncbi:MAG: 2-oxoacid:ferredoxin oxidoreductase subunit beta, partial [Planctomycetota bacterium]